MPTPRLLHHYRTLSQQDSVDGHMIINALTAERRCHGRRWIVWELQHLRVGFWGISATADVGRYLRAALMGCSWAEMATVNGCRVILKVWELAKKVEIQGHGDEQRNVLVVERWQCEGAEMMSLSWSLQGLDGLNKIHGKEIMKYHAPVPEHGSIEKDIMPNSHGGLIHGWMASCVGLMNCLSSRYQPGSATAYGDGNLNVSESVQTRLHLRGVAVRIGNVKQRRTEMETSTSPSGFKPGCTSSYQLNRAAPSIKLQRLGRIWKYRIKKDLATAVAVAVGRT
ncbi:hypothetical protein C8J56DRAFT_879497 [Mycena floridula]|nr:hypothetical protein C8J56DRAFT_879497 [Mycena floridula]